MKRLRGAAAAYLGLAIATGAVAQAPDGRGWVSAWTTAMQDPLPAGFTAGNPPPTSPQWAAMFTGDRARDQTFRQIVRPPAGGEKLRIRLSNLMGDRPPTLQNVSIAPRAAGRAIVAGASRRLTFGGAARVTIAPGREADSDMIDFALEPEKDVAVTMHLAGDPGPMTRHAEALVTSCLNGPGGGHRTGDASGAALPHELRSWLWLAEIQAWRDTERSTLVAIGDSSPDIARRQVNDRIRTSRVFDAVFDLDPVLRDPDYGWRLKPEFAAPDRIHPNPRGYAAIADAIPLATLDRGLPK